MQRTAGPHNVWVRRIGWMVVIWTASVAALALAASVLRWLMKLGGMTG
jgi:hypothetical protein